MSKPLSKWSLIGKTSTVNVSDVPAAVPVEGNSGNGLSPEKKSSKVNFEPSHRFANLKERLHLVRNRANGGAMNFSAITELVEEARMNRSAVIDAPEAIGSEIKNLLSMTPNAWRGILIREMNEYCRHLEFHFPGAMLEKQLLIAWHQCVRGLKLMEFSEGQDIISQGKEGTMCYWLLHGTAVRTRHQAAAALSAAALSPEHARHGHQHGLPKPVTVLGSIGEEVFHDLPYNSTVKAGGKVYCACLSVKEYKAAIKEAVESSSSSRSKLLPQLLLTAKTERNATIMKDLSSQLSIFELFRNMEPEFREEICSIVEYIAVPQGVTIFQEGEKVCFCYVILQGTVSFTQINAQTKRNEEIGIKSTGQHFGTLSTLSVGEKKRPFTAVAVEPCEFAVISRVGYNRIMKKQLKGVIEARASVVKSMAIMTDATDLIIQRVAFNSQNETFEAGHVIVNPACYPGKIYVIMEGECKVVWLTDDASVLPPLLMPLSQHAIAYHHGLTAGQQSAANAAAAAAALAAVAAADSDTKSGTMSVTNSLKRVTSNRSGRFDRGTLQRPPSNAKDMFNQQSTIRRASMHKEQLEREAKEAKGVRDAAQNLLQQMGNSSTMAVCGCGVAISPGPNPHRKRHALEVALLGRGDVLNGTILLGMAPALAVVARTKVRAFSMELDSVEDFFGPSAYRQLLDMLQQQRELNHQRLKNMLSVREDISTNIMSASQHRTMENDPTSQTQFLEHFVPLGPSDLGLEVKRFTTASAYATQDTPDSHPVGSQQPSLDLEVESVASSIPLKIASASTNMSRAAGTLPATFLDICKIGTATVEGEASAAKAAAHAARAAQKKKEMIEASVMSGEPAHHAPGTKLLKPTWSHHRAPNSVAPELFTGSMQATLGDMLESLSGSRQQVLGNGGGLTGGTSNWSIPAIHSEASIPSGLTKESSLMSTQSTASLPSLQGSWPTSEAAIIPGGKKSVAGGTRSRFFRLKAASAPMLSSPALMSKTKLQPILSISTAQHCHDRNATIMSFSQPPSSHPMLGAVPPSRAGGPGGDLGLKQVAILTESMSSYSSVLRPEEKKPDASYSSVLRPEEKKPDARYDSMPLNEQLLKCAETRGEEA
ncbi:hypothetical protein CEUSTIGMA_g10535.t1 [Chlamydomonas eustigma]|uniref:Cyclic nucleotide-binding domain-containing protein n=1 Tax=Chlamydomonas eustigma TaxID=1157962 RepID=A0A250XJK9_9CHLO|nr:hypothetical protein CEUSTIGMA_g10535.t1 [Chlamydomonas eustigma]|eukprot:GAX83109.1 hypothetical protein CEUSTIGMA_g10535.t1 [Chlamydomonas eustigma]